MATDSEAMRLLMDGYMQKAIDLRAQLPTFRDPLLRAQMSNIADDYEKMAKQLAGMIAIQERYAR